MFDIFTPLKVLIKSDEIVIDDLIFRIHCRITVIFLLSFSILVTSNQYFGDPIDCIVDKGVDQDIMDTFCWIQSTFILANPDGTYIESAPGVQPHNSDDKVVFQKYYQWVAFVLFLQAMLMYLPRYAWKTWEDGLMLTICSNLNSPILVGEDIQSKKEQIINYFKQHLGHHQTYAFKYIFCEVLNFCNVIGQLFLMDKFLNNAFFLYGLEVFGFVDIEEKWGSAMLKTFPRLTKCTFSKYGPSGSLVDYDGLCVLPLNVVNEKIYVFLWVWYSCLAVFSFFGVLFRFIELVSYFCRFAILRSRLRILHVKYVKMIAVNFRYGDIFVVTKMAKNLNPSVFADIVGSLCEDLEDQKFFDIDNFKLDSHVFDSR